ncbi:ATP-dependent RNA helicase dbp4 [Cladochytrium tenue]|nr:ATP-dependent RNA helicase dbp4 [Cladochytrium tenue]
MTAAQARLLAVAADPASAGRDVVFRARMGSGKTLAYLVAALELTLRWRSMEASAAAKKSNVTSVVVVVPTRELAAQVHKAARSLFRAHGMDALLLSSDVNIDKAIKAIVYDGRYDLWVVTPGRLLAVLDKEKAALRRLRQVKLVVLDEADKLVDKAGGSHTATALAKLPTAPLQTYAVSATVTRGIGQLLRLGGTMRLGEDPVVVDLVDENESDNRRAADDISQVASKELPIGPAEVARQHAARSEWAGTLASHQTYLICPIHQQLHAVLAVLESIAAAGAAHPSPGTDQPQQPPPSRPLPKAILFLNSWRGVRFAAAALARAAPPGLEIVELHAGLAPPARARATARFRAARGACVLVASDLAARGMHFENVAAVVHLGAPDSVSSYVHRVGRAARNVAAAEAVTEAAAAAAAAAGIGDGETPGPAAPGCRSVLVLAPFETAFVEELRRARVPVREELRVGPAEVAALERRRSPGGGAGGGLEAALRASVRASGLSEADAVDACIAFVRFYDHKRTALRLSTSALLANTSRYAISRLGLPGLPRLPPALARRLRPETAENVAALREVGDRGYYAREDHGRHLRSLKGGGSGEAANARRVVRDSDTMPGPQPVQVARGAGGGGTVSGIVSDEYEDDGWRTG